MCGIVGIFSRRGTLPREDLLRDSSLKALFRNDTAPLSRILQRSIQVLEHRGPDCQKIWVAPSGMAGLGHARLSIIDLKSGDQPLSSENKRIHAVINGEFYGFQEIRKDLHSKGYGFKTESDSEILLPLYQEFGAQCVHALRGEFAWILWDEEAQTLVAARDRFGIKPLYYSLHNGSLYLASEIKSLFAAGIPVQWDYESFYQTNMLGASFQDRTLFQGVFQVPPGHYLIATHGGIKLVQYWDFNYPRMDSERLLGKGSQGRSEKETIEQFHSVLNEAVKLRLHADVPVGCYLSGGLDSCSVLGLAARNSSTPIQVFTIGFDQGDYDESSIAEEMAKQCHARFHQISVQQNDLADHFSSAIWHAETLFFNSHGIAKYLLSKAVRDLQYKVVLTGEGSDEILAGYPHFRRDLVLYHSYDKTPEERQELLKRLTKSNAISSGLLLPHGEGVAPNTMAQVLGHMPSWAETFFGIGQKYFQIYSEHYIQRVSNKNAHRDFLDGLQVHQQLEGRDPVHKSMYLWSKCMLPNYILTVLGDRMEMAHSVEGRVPFLDHKVVEFAREVPLDLKIKSMTEKYLLREAARPVLSKTVYERQKHPFFAPPAALNPEGKLYQMVQDSIRSEEFKSVPFFDQGKLIQLLDRMPTMDTASISAFDGVFCGVLSAYMLQKRFVSGHMSQKSSG